MPDLVSRNAPQAAVDLAKKGEILQPPPPPSVASHSKFWKHTFNARVSEKGARRLALLRNSLVIIERKCALAARKYDIDVFQRKNDLVSGDLLVTAAAVARGSAVVTL